MFAPFIKTVFEANDTLTFSCSQKQKKIMEFFFGLVVLHSAPDEPLCTHTHSVLWSLCSRALERMVSSCICCFGWGSKGRWCTTDELALLLPSFLRLKTYWMRCMARRAKSTWMCNGMKHFSQSCRRRTHPTHNNTNRNRDRWQRKKVHRRKKTGNKKRWITINVCKRKQG